MYFKQETSTNNVEIVTKNSNPDVNLGTADRLQPLAKYTAQPGSYRSISPVMAWLQFLEKERACPLVMVWSQRQEQE